LSRGAAADQMVDQQLEATRQRVIPSGPRPLRRGLRPTSAGLRSLDRPAQPFLPWTHAARPWARLSPPSPAGRASTRTGPTPASASWQTRWGSIQPAAQGVNG